MRNRPYGFEIYLVNVKTIKTIAQIFVAFSEKLNFTDNMTTKKRGFLQLRAASKNHYLLLLRLKLHGEQLCQFYCHYHSGSLP